MSLADLINRPCTITRRSAGAALDRYNNRADDEHLVRTVCELQQRARDEHEDRGEISRTTWLLVLPAGTALSSGDTVTVEGLDYEVLGDPARWRNPRTQQDSHVEATVVLTSGPEDHPAGS